MREPFVIGQIVGVRQPNLDVPPAANYILTLSKYDPDTPLYTPELKNGYYRLLDASKWAVFVEGIVVEKSGNVVRAVIFAPLGLPVVTAGGSYVTGGLTPVTSPSQYLFWNPPSGNTHGTVFLRASADVYMTIFPNRTEVLTQPVQLTVGMDTLPAITKDPRFAVRVFDPTFSSLSIPAPVNITLSTAWVFDYSGFPDTNADVLRNKNVVVRRLLDFGGENMVYVYKTEEFMSHVSLPSAPNNFLAQLVIDYPDIFFVHSFVPGRASPVGMPAQPNLFLISNAVMLDEGYIPGNRVFTDFLKLLEYPFEPTFYKTLTGGFFTLPNYTTAERENFLTMRINSLKYSEKLKGIVLNNNLTRTDQNIAVREEHLMRTALDMKYYMRARLRVLIGMINNKATRELAKTLVDTIIRERYIRTIPQYEIICDETNNTDGAQTLRVDINVFMPATLKYVRFTSFVQYLA